MDNLIKYIKSLQSDRLVVMQIKPTVLILINALDRDDSNEQ